MNQFVSIIVILNKFVSKMTDYKEYKIGGSNSPFGFLGPLLILAVFFAALFFLAKGMFWLLSWVAPVLLIITLIIDYNIVKNFFVFIWKLLNDNPVMGILAVLMVIFAYPFVAGYLFVKALGVRTIKKAIGNVQKEQNSYTDYEEVDDEDDSFLDLPSLKKKPELTKQAKSNEYDYMLK